jgi:hypothetical protein
MNTARTSRCLALLSLFVLFQDAALEAQKDPVAVDHFFYSGNKKVPLTVAVDKIGVLWKEETGLQSRARLAAPRGQRMSRQEEVTEGMSVFELQTRVDLRTLAAVARELRRERPELVAQAGLVVREAGAEKPMFATDEFIVQLEPGVSLGQLQALNAAHGVVIATENPFVPGQFVLRVTDQSDATVLDLANLYHESTLTEFAHPNFVRAIVFRETVPNDPLFANQWHHANGGLGGGTADADIDAPEAWDITQGQDSVIIAVLDGGFDLAHADLTPNFWTNPGEIAGDGIDNDGNSFVDDVNGWDFTGCAVASPGCGDNNPTGPDTPSGRHGTSVAGVAAARGDNAVGVTGSCQRCRLMLLRSSFSTPFIDALAFGYARQRGAQIITNSWGYPIGTSATTAVVTAINDAATSGRGGLGCVVLFAMNNPAVNDCSGPAPDISSLANVIAVSRSTNQDRFSSGGFGNCMDVLAPTAGSSAGSGTRWITTTDITGSGGYNNTAESSSCPTPEAGPPPADSRSYTGCFNGTSSATPLTAGIAGLALSVNPGLTRLQVQRLLQDTTDRIEDSAGAYNDDTGFSSPASGNATHGWGRVNAFEAVRTAAPVAQGGRGGVDVYLRDNRLDWGNTEQPSNVLFEPTRGFIPHWQSVDIKVDAPPYVTPSPTTSAGFDAFAHENPKAGEDNRVYVRVRNRGFTAAASVTVKLLWAFAGAGLPALPADFWSAFPADPATTASWHPLACGTGGGTSCSVSSLGYSGSSVAGTAADAVQIVRFDFPGPTVDPSRPDPEHFCLFAVLDSPQDHASPLVGSAAPSHFVPDLLTPGDNNVTHRNVRVEPGGRSDTVERFFVRNPTAERATVTLRLYAPPGWEVELDRFAFGQPFTLEPGQELLVTLRALAPRTGAVGDVEVRQETEAGKLRFTGGMTYRFGSTEGPHADSRRLLYSFHVGSTHPLGRLDDRADANIHLHADASYGLSDRYRLLLMGGLSQLTSEVATETEHPRWLNLSLDVQALFPSASGLRYFLQGGVGSYWPKSGPSDLGFNLGFGAQIPLPAPFGLELGVDYHAVQDKARTRFLTVQLGVLFR